MFQTFYSLSKIPFPKEIKSIDYFCFYTLSGNDRPLRLSEENPGYGLDSGRTGGWENICFKKFCRILNPLFLK